MDVARTFVVRVTPDSTGTLLENVRTRERVRVSDLSEVPERIARWLDPDGAREPTREGGEDGQDH